MNCVGLMSNIYKFGNYYDVGKFDQNPNVNLIQTLTSNQGNVFETLQNSLISTDLVAILGKDDIGDTNNHIISYLGSTGPQSGVPDQILESTAKNGIGVRFSNLKRLLDYYNSTGYPYVVKYYRPKT